jgi:hypothetical protein
MTADFKLNKAVVRGQTFSLYGDGENSNEFYSRLDQAVEECLKRNPDIRGWLKLLRRYAKRKCLLKKMAQGLKAGNDLDFLTELSAHTFTEFTRPAEEHLRNLRLWDYFRDRTLATSREQYHLYILEFELVNRLYKKEFHHCAHKVALLPHCLRFTIEKCKAETDGLDLVCQDCSKSCFVNKVSHILRARSITPYIWMESELKDFFQRRIETGAKVGVLGIACIAELVRGMRRCEKAGVPVVGIPLNANCCARWKGKWYPTSVNWKRLSDLC